MKKKNVLSLALLITLPLAVTLMVWANVPPDRPPVNQIIGIPDVDYNDLREEDCRFCHENPDLVEGNTNIPDRHHLLYGSPIPENSQVKDPDANNDGTPDTTYGCLNCHSEDTTGGIITMVVYRNCAVDCHVQSSSSYPSVHHRTAEAQGGNCVHCHGTLVENPLGCKELYCAVASSSAGSTRGVPLIPCIVSSLERAQSMVYPKPC